MGHPTDGRPGDRAFGVLCCRYAQILVPALLILPFCSIPFHPLDSILFDGHLPCARQCCRCQRDKTDTVPALMWLILLRRGQRVNSIMPLDKRSGQTPSWGLRGLGLNPGSITDLGEILQLQGPDVLVC